MDDEMVGLARYNFCEDGMVAGSFFKSQIGCPGGGISYQAFPVDVFGLRQCCGDIGVSIIGFKTENFDVCSCGLLKKEARMDHFGIVENDNGVGGEVLRDVGENVFAEGVIFSDGTCAMRWLSHWTSTAIYGDIKLVDHIHGHNGKTRIVYDLPKM